MGKKKIQRSNKSIRANSTLSGTTINQRLSDISIKGAKAKTLDNPQVEAIGKKLLEIRTSLGMTQDQVKVKSGLTPKQIVDLEKGRTNFTIESLINYLNAIQSEIIIQRSLK